MSRCLNMPEMSSMLYVTRHGPGPVLVNGTGRPAAKVSAGSTPGRTAPGFGCCSERPGEPVDDGGRRLVRGCGPDGLVEDLDLDVPGVARGGHRGADGREVDVAVADVTAAEEGVGGQRQDPVAHLVADDPLARAGDVGEQRRVPPD